MAIAKLRWWEISLIKAIALPILTKVADILEAKAAKTETLFDDALVGSFRTVIEFLKSPDMFEET